MANRTEEAIEISDRMLKATEAAYRARDFEAYAKCFHLPQLVGTFAGEKTINTREELKTLFLSMCEHYESRGVIALVRRTIEAEFVDPVTVQATFVAQQIMRDNILSPPTVAIGLLREIDGVWVVMESHYATEDSETTRAIIRNLP